ncbi:MAG: PHP domain-containing protein [Clostridiales bacterium]|nr:PHP domain-containing protein [Clostridiales bacterium]
MKIFADYHTHTNYSHGRGTPEENVLAAVKKGLRRIAVSEHAGAHLFYGVRGEKLRALRQEIDRLNKRYGNRIEVLMGLECNLLGGGKCDLSLPHALWPKGFDAAPFDVLLLGFHKGIMPRDKLTWQAMGEAFGIGRADPVKVAGALLETAANHGIHMLSHPGEYVKADIPTLAKGAAQLGILLEINASHVSLTPKELREAASCGAKFVAGSDAHTPERVGCFDAALSAAEKAGVTGHIVNGES